MSGLDERPPEVEWPSADQIALVALNIAAGIQMALDTNEAHPAYIPGMRAVVQSLVRSSGLLTTTGDPGTALELAKEMYRVKHGKEWPW